MKKSVIFLVHMVSFHKPSHIYRHTTYMHWLTWLAFCRNFDKPIASLSDNKMCPVVIALSLSSSLSSQPHPLRSSGGHCTHRFTIATSSVCASLSVLSSPVCDDTCGRKVLHYNNWDACWGPLLMTHNDAHTHTHARTHTYTHTRTTLATRHFSTEYFWYQWLKTITCGS